jgi:hypothetical protein
VKLCTINGLTRIGIMSHWYTPAQWCNQFPEDAIFNKHITFKSIKASLTAQDNVQPGRHPRRRVVQRRKCAGRVLLTISSNRQRRSAGQRKPPEHQRRREWTWKVRM